MHNRQRGITAIGLIIVLIFLGVIGLGVIQLVPVYLENIKVQQVMNQTRDKLNGQKATPLDIRKALSAAADIEDLREIKPREDFVISRTADGFRVDIDYSRERAFIANIYLLAKFKHSIEINR